MSRPDGRSVLWCEQCDKPFTKQSALKRHGYYCRSRKTDRSNRLRSCISCARAKARCDNQRPACSRCKEKNLTCHLRSDTPRVANNLRAHHDGHATSTSKAESSTPAFVPDTSAVDFQPSSSDIDAILDDAHLFLDDSENPWWSLVDAGIANPASTESNDPLLMPATPGLMTQLTAPLSGTPYICSFEQSPAGKVIGSQPHSRSSGLPLFETPSSLIRSLVQRPNFNAGQQRTTYLLLSNLKSYSRMLRNGDLPPFVHPSLLSPREHAAEVEALDNCLNLMHMISSKMRGSRKLFWENVRRECERLGVQHPEMTKWELLAAMQALSIYILVRLEEGETDHNNLDTMLVGTVVMLAREISRHDNRCHAGCSHCTDRLEMPWQEWIFKESRRRLSLIYRVINKLIYFDPMGMCDMPDEFLLAPLPARKQLWEAESEHTWQIEKRKEPLAQISYGLASHGDIVRLDEGRLSCSDAWLPARSTSESCNEDKSNTYWEEWCSGIDGFGGLVMLTASLAV